MKTSWLSVFALLLTAGNVQAAPATDVGNLGTALLDEELARALAPATSSQTADDIPSLLPDPQALDRMLQQGAAEAAGEDVGQSPMTGVVRDMRRAEDLLRSEANDRAAVPVQREVVQRLEELISKMEKQCQGGSCNKPNQQDQQKQASKRSQPKPAGECDKEGQCDKPGEQVAKAGKNANKSGATKLGSAADVDPAQQQELMKAAWGHLPERMREQMLQGAQNEFLPEYREELRAYFRRLAERPSEEAP